MNFDYILENPSLLMEKSGRLVVEISSDEEASDSDAVVSPNPRKRLKIWLKPPSVKIVKDDCDDDDDDDCVILDGNPEKIVSVNVRACDESDTLQIVGEKGEIACRDFPHSRHLCVSFPFASTAHQVHCLQCHCYVCDSLAPCALWGTGISPVDHCNASDKEKCWRLKRECRKKHDKPVRVIPPDTDNLPRALLETTPIPTMASLFSRSSRILPSSMSLLVSMPPIDQNQTHMLNRVRTLEQHFVLMQARQTSLPPPPRRTNVPSPNRNQNAGNPSVRCFTLPTVSKKPGAASVVSPKGFRSTPPVLPLSSTRQRAEIDEICEHCVRSSRSGGHSLFLVRWRGRPSSDTSWISAAELQRLAPDLWRSYEDHTAA